MLTIPLRRVWRIVRQAPLRGFTDWKNAFLNEGNLITFLTATASSYLALRTTNLPEIFDEASKWQSAATALLYVAAGWAALCFLRAPVMLFLEERRDGAWFGGRYVLHRPREVFQVRAKATGKPEFYRFSVPFAEPRSFIYYKVTCDRDVRRELYTADVIAEVLLLPLEPGRGCLSGGTRLGDTRAARLMVVMRPEAISQTFRVWCSEFEFGDPDEQHGETGDANLPWLDDWKPR